MAQLVCRDLSVGPGGREGWAVLSGLNFAVEAGDYLCVIGENGSGKTTLMRTLLGLLPPLAGSVTLGDGLRRNEIGYLPQQTEVQRDFPASVREIVLSGCQGRCGLRPFYNREERRLASQAMARMGVEDLAGRCYRELSGGQQQRVLLARALCAARRVLFLDEPVAGLDPQATLEMYRVIGELNRRDGVTVVMISHDVGAALERASRILRVGASVFFGTAQEYRARSGEARS